MKMAIFTDVLCLSRALVTVYPFAKSINNKRKTSVETASSAFPEKNNNNSKCLMKKSNCFILTYQSQDIVGHSVLSVNRVVRCQ